MELLTKRGRLTAYAFACGYVEHYGDITLSWAAPAYLINGFRPDGERVATGADTLAVARKLARSLNR